jgi:uncharacterized protein
MIDKPMDTKTIQISWTNLLGLILILFMTEIFVGVFEGLLIEIQIIQNQLNKDAVQLLFDFIRNLIILIVTLIYIRKNDILREIIVPLLKFAPFRSYKTYIYILISFLAVIAAEILIHRLAPYSPLDQAAKLHLLTLSKQSIWIVSTAILTTGIVTPIYEEIIFRGVFLRILETKYSFGIGVFISSIVFGLFHLYNIGLVIWSSFVGFVLAMLYKKTRSILPGVILHILTNTLATILHSV